MSDQLGWVVPYFSCFLLRIEDCSVSKIMSGIIGDNAGLCRAANEKHARDLPVMNGIKEDIKSIGVLDSGKPVYQEALSNLKTRLKTLKV